MAKKRKASHDTSRDLSKRTEYDPEERFEESEDEFFAERDKILLDGSYTGKRRHRVEIQEKELQHSDEEVFAQSDTDSDGEETSIHQNHVGNEEDDDVHGDWGTVKADYYNADVIETEADAINEETEAKRLQQKQLKGMTEADFGFDEIAWSQPLDTTNTKGRVVEKLPDTSISAEATEQELVEILRHRYPEFSLLAKDFIELQLVWNELHNQMDPQIHLHRQGITVRTKLHALTAYLGAISMYFAIIASSNDPGADASKITAFPPSELREHKVIDNLVRSRQMWDTVKDAKEFEYRKEQVPSMKAFTKSLSSLQQSRAGGKSHERESKEPSSELEDLEEIEMISVPMVKAKTTKKSVSLQSLLAQSTITNVDNDLDFGDEDPLTEQQAEEKLRKKKSLRFYTSQIAQKANRRGAASRDAGGDDDMPHKERLRDKQERLQREAEKRGQQQATAEEELGGESDADARSDSNNGYYQSLVAKSQNMKAQKKERAAAYAEATRQGARVLEDEQIGADGKRKITYAIEKNKGLAPKRKKDVRNPRVKKRKKFDEKMKKLGSIRQVYKGGEGRGGYGGELTGIKTNIVKSVRL